MDIYSDDGGRSDLGGLLDSLRIEQFFPSAGATRIWRSSDLPPRLEQQVQRLPGGVRRGVPIPMAPSSGLRSHCSRWRPADNRVATRR